MSLLVVLDVLLLTSPIVSFTVLAIVVSMVLPKTFMVVFLTVFALEGT